METLKLDKKKAKKLFKNASSELKEILIDTFGSDCFTGNIIDQIESIEDAYEAADDKTREEYKKSVAGFNTPDELAYKQKKLIAKVLQEDWKARWDDLDQKKWFPVFKWVPGSGFVFSYSDYGYGDACTAVGSRFCFKDEATSDYFGKQFIEIHRKCLTI